MKFKHKNYEFAVKYLGSDNRRCHVELKPYRWWCELRDTPISKKQMLLDAEQCIVEYEVFLAENAKYPLDGNKTNFTYKGYAFKCYENQYTDCIIAIYKTTTVSQWLFKTTKKVRLFKKIAYLENYETITNKRLLKEADLLISIVDDDVGLSLMGKVVM
jgi:hypothetical protein